MPYKPKNDWGTSITRYNTEQQNVAQYSYSIDVTFHAAGVARLANWTASCGVFVTSTTGQTLSNPVSNNVHSRFHSLLSVWDTHTSYDRLLHHNSCI